VAAEQTTQSIALQMITPLLPTVLVVGGETTGVSQQVLDFANAVVAIPMLGMANSLNVSTAAAIFLYALRPTGITSPNARSPTTSYKMR
jgi:tRNA G18 (ribose-2'-O)-methylase SpoU